MQVGLHRQAMDVRKLSRDRFLVALGEPRRKPAAGDLAGRPPQRMGGDLALPAAPRRVIADPARPVPGEQPPAKE